MIIVENMHKKVNNLHKNEIKSKNIIISILSILISQIIHKIISNIPKNMIMNVKIKSYKK